MIGSEELNKLLKLYREEDYPNNVSVEDLAKKYGVSPTVFHNWIRATSSQVVPVKIIRDGDDPAPKAETRSYEAEPHKPRARRAPGEQPIAKVTVELSDGTKLSKSNLNHPGLVQWSAC